MHVVTSKGKGSRQWQRGSALLENLSEAALLKRARRKDAGAFEELVGRTEDRAYQVAIRYVRNESDAQEILQNVYLSAWLNLQSFDGRSQFASWMYRVTVNASLMLLRVRSRHLEVAVDNVEPTEINGALVQNGLQTGARNNWSQRPDEEVQSAELRHQIEMAVRSLPEGVRITFLLRDVDEMSTEDAAGRLGISIPALKMRLHRARKVLRKSLGSYVAC
jgi:RNA polymerase sigma-70 factor (ECF subfamily)